MEAAAARTTAPPVGYPTVGAGDLGQRSGPRWSSADGRSDERRDRRGHVRARRWNWCWGWPAPGKTTMLDVVRAAFEAAGYRVSGHVHVGAGGPHPRARRPHMTRPAPWRRCCGGSTTSGSRLDPRTVVIVDEAAMTDDPALLRLLDGGGDGRGQDGPGRRPSPAGRGRPGRRLRRHWSAATATPCTCCARTSAKQDHEERRDPRRPARRRRRASAVDWYAAHDRIRHRCHPRPRPSTRLVDAWYADVPPGVRCGDVRLAPSQRRRPEPAGPSTLGRRRPPDRPRARRVAGGRRYEAGDRIVTLAPAADGRLVTSRTGHGRRRRPELRPRWILRMDDGQHVQALRGRRRCRIGSTTATPRTVHRSQGATVDAGHRFDDGGGRELAYVAMSPSPRPLHRATWSPTTSTRPRAT